MTKPARQYRIKVYGEKWETPNSGPPLLAISTATRPWGQALRVMERLRRSHPLTFVQRVN